MLRLYKFLFALSFAWAFLWRLIILFGFMSQVQLKCIQALVYGANFSIPWLTVISLTIAFLCLLPFVLAVYWMLERGVMARITHKYAHLLQKSPAKQAPSQAWAHLWVYVQKGLKLFK